LKIDNLKVSHWVGNLLHHEVLIIHDKQDKIISYREAANLVNNWKTSRLTLTEGLGHNRIMKSDKVIADMIDYLNDEVPKNSEQPVLRPLRLKETSAR